MSLSQALYEIALASEIVAQGNSPGQALSAFRVYAKLAKSGQQVELRRNGAVVISEVKFNAEK